MTISPAITKRIEARASESALRMQAAEEGMQLLAEHAATRVCAGTTSAPAHTAADDAPAVTAAPPSPQNFRVLVVDDQEDQREMIAFTLENAELPLSTTTAANGQEALDRAQANPPHLILLDVMMPDIDGFEVCTRLRADVRTASIPIIMLTALADDTNCERGFRAGTDDYIRKPLSAPDLLARVKRILERAYGASFRAPPATGTGAELRAARVTDG